MTIEQAIEHAERAYKESRNGLQYALKRGETRFAERCKKEAEENRQLAEWLRELQERRKAPEITYCKDCKAIYCDFCLKTLKPVEKEKDYCSLAERRTDE